MTNKHFKVVIFADGTVVFVYPDREDGEQMFIKAIYEPTNEKCLINTDFIVDVFQDGANETEGRAFTFDNERGGYLITLSDLEEKESEQMGDIGYIIGIAIAGCLMLISLIIFGIYVLWERWRK